MLRSNFALEHQAGGYKSKKHKDKNMYYSDPPNVAQMSQLNNRRVYLKAKKINILNFHFNRWCVVMAL